MMSPTYTKLYPNSQVLTCPECGGEMVLRVSPKYRDPFYGCTRFPECRSTHGAKPDGSPLGTPADKETKQWRRKAHEVFDCVWGEDNQFLSAEERKHRRSIAYRWLADKMQMNDQRELCNIGHFDSEQCQAVITLCANVTWSDVVEWHHSAQSSYSAYPGKKAGFRRKKLPRYAHY